MSSRAVLHLPGASFDGVLDPAEGNASSSPGEIKSRQLNTSSRRFIKRNTLARGLAREYDAQRARENSYKTHMAHQVEQKKKAQACTKSGSLGRLSGSPARGIEFHNDVDSDKEREDSGADRDTNENENGVVLRLRARPKISREERTGHTGGIRAGTASRPRTLVVPARQGLSLSRITRFRREIPSNQSDDAAEVEDDGCMTSSGALKHSTLSTDLNLSAPLALPSPYPGAGGVWAAKSPEAPPSPSQHHLPPAIGSMSHWRPDRSSALVLCELQITKDIMTREHSLRQLSEAATVFDEIAAELIEAVEAKKSAEAAAASGAARMLRLRQGSSRLLALSQPESGSQAQSQAAAVASLKHNVETLSVAVDKLTEKIRQRLRQIGSLIGTVRTATAGVVEGVAEWRSLHRRRRFCSNVEELMRFPWKYGKVPNYILHLQADARTLFRSTAISCLLGADAEFNALLLPSSALRALQKEQQEAGDVAAPPSKTFLTDKVASVVGSSEVSASQPFMDVPAPDQHLYFALMTAAPGLFDPSTETAEQAQYFTPGDLSRWRSCLRLIRHELELEKLDDKRRDQDALRLQHSYNPFLAIKAAGGVDEQLSTLIAEQSPHVEKLRQQLRHRQQDATDCAMSGNASEDSRADRVANTAEGAATAGVNARGGGRLRVSTRRLHGELQRRRALIEAALQCETREFVVACAPGRAVGAKRNRLQGKILVRKPPVPRFRREDRLASVIQRQFRAYQARGNVLQSLADLVGRIKASAVSIQRIYRGYKVRLRFRDALRRRCELRHQRMWAARTIALIFRRYKRRQRHRRSVTVVAVAQAQIQSMLEFKAQEADDASARRSEEVERLRQLGADRRRYRARMMEQQRREQLALEVKETAAAIRIQSIVRSQLAQRTADALKQEKKAHIAAVSAITIQSSIRTFLVRQEARRLRFRKDLERVNRSAERIQRVYRDYNLRARDTLITTVGEGDGSEESEGEDQPASDGDEWSGKLPALVQYSSRPDLKSAPVETERVVLPLLMRPTAPRVPRRLPRQSTTAPTPATAATVPMMRIELKLKEPVIDFQAAPSGSNSARRGLFQGWHGHA